MVLFNTLSWDRSDPIRLPDGRWIDGVAVPAGGWTVIDMGATGGRGPELVEGLSARASSAKPDLTVSQDGRRIQSRFWRIRLDKQGRISELFDRANNRQVLPKGAAANEWQVFEDRSAHWDAWDIPQYYTDHPLPGPQLAGIQVTEQDAVHVAVEITWKMPPVGTGPRSVITQRMIVYANHPRIDFDTQVDWHEHHAVLKAAFAVDIRATEATYQVQFGHLRRPTHTNTSWDMARFEVPAQQFADLAEHGYGVALLNDCKYGYHIHGNLMRLTCLRSSQSPHWFADQGRHEFTYSLLPHAGSFQEAGVIRAAAELNTPVLAVATDPHTGRLPPTFRFTDCDSAAAVIDTIKPAEDGDGLILRLYESHGSHTPVTLRFATAPKRVEHVNLLEQPHDEEVGLKHNSQTVSLRLRPFQVASLRVT